MLLLLLGCAPPDAAPKDTGPADTDTGAPDTDTTADTDTGPDDTAPDTAPDTGPDDTDTSVDTGTTSSALEASARWTLTGTAADDHAGIAVLVAPDMDGDGAGELVVGVAGRGSTAGLSGGVMRVRLPLSASRTWDDADVRYGGSVDSRFGSALAAGDLDADGLADLVVGDPSAGDYGGTAGSVSVWFGPSAGGDDVTDADAWEQGAPLDHLGTTVSVAGDLDGRGDEDLVVGGFSTAWVFRGPLRAGLARADAWEITCGSSGQPAPVGGEDLDGDGVVDLAVGCPGDAAEGVEGAGAVYVWAGPVDGPRGPADADAVLFGGQADGAVGTRVALAGDRDGDGNTDLAVGAPMHAGTTELRGVVFLPLGPSVGAAALDDATDRVLGLAEIGDEDAWTGLGYGGIASGDVDADGTRDLLVGASPPA